MGFFDLSSSGSPYRYTCAIGTILLFTACASSQPPFQDGRVLLAAAEIQQRPAPTSQRPSAPTKPKAKRKSPPSGPKQPSPPVTQKIGPGDALPVASTERPDILGAAASLRAEKGVLPGASIGGLPGAVWADQNNDGNVDGFEYYGNYYVGIPTGYDPVLGRVVTGIAVRGALGAAAGAIIPGVSVLEGAVIGAAVVGVPGAVWADQDHDGQVDGYIYNGTYYPGAPRTTPLAPPTPKGERG